MCESPRVWGFGCLKVWGVLESNALGTPESLKDQEGVGLLVWGAMGADVLVNISNTI